MVIGQVNISEILPQTAGAPKSGDGLFGSLLESLIASIAGDSKGDITNFGLFDETGGTADAENNLKAEIEPRAEEAVISGLFGTLASTCLPKPDIQPPEPTTFSICQNEFNITDDIDNSNKFAGIPEGFELLETNGDNKDLEVLIKAQNTGNNENTNNAQKSQNTQNTQNTLDIPVQQNNEEPALHHMQPIIKPFVKTDEKSDGSPVNTNTEPVAGKTLQTNHRDLFAAPNEPFAVHAPSESAQDKPEGLFKQEKETDLEPQTKAAAGNAMSEFFAPTDVQSQHVIKTHQMVENAVQKTPEQSFAVENFENIVQSVKANMEGEQKQFEVELKPEHLGKLKIRLVMEEDGIKAFIKAGDSQVKNILQSECANLCDTLKAKGVNITNMDISYEPPVFADTDTGREANRHHEQKGTKRRVQSAERTGAGYDAPYIMRETSSVEFCA